jgi:predicted phosphoadenosine phosphosulfate sulfurtransferase
MYPLYDWTYNDVWAAIHRNKWPYNKIYDAQYSRGVTVMDMRVSNIHHETAVHSLFYLQEVEPQTYVKLTQRIKGIDMAGKMGKDDYFVHELPPMFASWFEYRDHLLKNLIQDESWREKMAKEFARMEESYLSGGMKEQTLCMAQIQSILTNDHEFVKLKNFERKKECMKIRRIKAGKIWRD